MGVKEWRFSIWINEGAFFHEPWLCDSKTNKDYRYDRVPTRIMLAMVEECKCRGSADPEKFRLMVDFILVKGEALLKKFPRIPMPKPAKVMASKTQRRTSRASVKAKLRKSHEVD